MDVSCAVYGCTLTGDYPNNQSQNGIVMKQNSALAVMSPAE